MFGQRVVYPLMRRFWDDATCEGTTHLRSGGAVSNLSVSRLGCASNRHHSAQKHLVS